jgi:DNA-binding GntR family transcriptional regulator
MNPTGATRSHNHVSEAYERLRESIVHGLIAPGSRVIESALAERLGTSRTPVRSALYRLQQEGYVIAARGGTRTRLIVAPLTKEDGRELFWIVGELEGVAADRVARRPLEERERLAEELLGINQELRTASREVPPDPGRIFALHTRFHQCYVGAGAGPRVRAMYGTVEPQAERYRRLYSTALGGQIEDSLAEHEVIARAIAEGNPAAAEGAVKANWRNAAERLARVIEQVGERGSW